MKKVPTNQIEIVNKSWMQLVINKEDGYVNGTLLSEQTFCWLGKFLRSEESKENIEHIINLTGQRVEYIVTNPWDNIKGRYIHPFIALQLVAMRKEEDSDYIEYYEFLKTVIAEDNKYKWIEMFHDLKGEQVIWIS